MRKLMIVMVMGFSLQVLTTQVWASQRIALVIGNAVYEHAPGLANPLNDANDIGAALGRLGFKVTKLENADYDTMRRGSGPSPVRRRARRSRWHSTPATGSRWTSAIS